MFDPWRPYGRNGPHIGQMEELLRAEERVQAEERAERENAAQWAREAQLLLLDD